MAFVLKSHEERIDNLLAFWDSNPGAYELLSRALTMAEACGFLGVGRTTLRRWQKRFGIGFQVPSRTSGKPHKWYFQEGELRSLQLRWCGKKKKSDIREENGEVPIHLAIRLLQMKPMSICQARWRGKLPNLSPEAIREYILRIQRDPWRTHREPKSVPPPVEEK